MNFIGQCLQRIAIVKTWLINFRKFPPVVMTYNKLWKVGRFMVQPAIFLLSVEYGRTRSRYSDKTNSERCNRAREINFDNKERMSDEYAQRTITHASKLLTEAVKSIIEIEAEVRKLLTLQDVIKLLSDFNMDPISLQSEMWQSLLSTKAELVDIKRALNIIEFFVRDVEVQIKTNAKEFSKTQAGKQSVITLIKFSTFAKKKVCELKGIIDKVESDMQCQMRCDLKGVEK